MTDDKKRITHGQDKVDTRRNSAQTASIHGTNLQLQSTNDGWPAMSAAPAKPVKPQAQPPKQTDK